jgi:hypothetical protein
MYMDKLCCLAMPLIRLTRICLAQICECSDRHAIDTHKLRPTFIILILHYM